ncbi:MAG TPA: glycosyltransferase family A protein [Candidatus Acidoferrales bacterium]|nr:glycosyltransferase family A protein [Candidatus Acidoferrales bacterium]
MRVSIIVPNYNHARFLRQRIDTILAQTFQDFELILLDDCSTDDSRSILSSYSSDPRVRLDFNDANSGSTYKQWNKGVRLARCEYVWIAESDDYADERFLERLVPALDSKPEVVFVTCRSLHVGEDGQPQPYAEIDLPYLVRYDTTIEVDGREECRNHFVSINTVYNASSVLFRKSVYDQVGGADETFRFCGDWKLWAAMALSGRIVYVSKELNYRRVHHATVTSGSEREGLAQAEYLRVMRWLLGKVRPTDSARQGMTQVVRWSWTPAVSSWHLPLRTRFSILRDAIAVDPSNTLRGVIPAGLGALRRKFVRHWHSIQSARRSA